MQLYPIDSVCYMYENGQYSTCFKAGEATTVLENKYIRAIVPGVRSPSSEHVVIEQGNDVLVG